jgi:DNA polymerase III epsilon subunit-like protein
VTSDELYISVDVETSGPIPGRYSLLAIGAVVVGSPHQRFYMELRPISPEFDMKAMAVSRLSLEHLLVSGTDPAEGMRSFARWVELQSREQTPVFVGFNAAFDWAFINWYFHTYIGSNPFGFAPLDIKALYMGAFGSSWADTRSSRLRIGLRSVQPTTHNALDDAVWQAEAFQQILDRRLNPRG